MFALTVSVQVGALSPSLVRIQDHGESRAPQPAAGRTFAQSLERAREPGVISSSRTALSEDEAKEALAAAWKAHFGEEPRQETTAILTAQWAHETGDGRSMFNFNFGGIKGTGPSGLSVAQRTREGFGANETTIVDRFRAYQTAEEGASDYIGLLRRKYAGALDAAQSGDPGAFVQELHKGGYFTGSPSDYSRSVTTRTQRILGRSPELTAERAPPGIAMPAPSVAQVEQRSLPPNANLARFDDHFAAFNAPDTHWDVQALDDTLSRAALRIAASSLPSKRNERT